MSKSANLNQRDMVNLSKFVKIYTSENIHAYSSALRPYAALRELEEPDECDIGSGKGHQHEDVEPVAEVDGGLDLVQLLAVVWGCQDQVGAGRV